jgi:predicted small metal-binding protein
MKTFSCRDVGVDCDWETRGERDEDILRAAEEHGRKEHGFKEFTQELKDKVLAKIRDLKAA